MTSEDHGRCSHCHRGLSQHQSIHGETPSKTMDHPGNEGPRKRRKDVPCRQRGPSQHQSLHGKCPQKTMDDSDNEGPRKRGKDVPAATEAPASTKAPPKTPQKTMDDVPKQAQRPQPAQKHPRKHALKRPWTTQTMRVHVKEVRLGKRRSCCHRGLSQHQSLHRKTPQKSMDDVPAATEALASTKASTENALRRP
ncbi:FOG2 [Mytilus edulis]|uniref:ZFPM2 n=1 Tax=Mytilus edulis TaxID=6550 RepID=A0A8S3QVV5_MYTED|nr:FOG2 [Mytilus edulis]